MNLVHKTKLARNFVIQHESQYKFLYDFVRNILSGKYADLMEAGVLSDNGFERLSSAELVEADYDEPKKMVSWKYRSQYLWGTAVAPYTVYRIPRVNSLGIAIS